MALRKPGPTAAALRTLKELKAACFAEQDLAQKMVAAKARTAELIEECLAAGFELAAVAAATGLSSSGTRSRLKADPSRPDAWPATLARVEAAEKNRGRPRTRGPLPPAPVGYARKTEAAVILGLSRSGIYHKLAMGDLTEEVIDGKKYVRLPTTAPRRRR